jgi:hypothetical protein
MSPNAFCLSENRCLKYGATALAFQRRTEKKRGYFFKTAPHAIKRKIHRLKPLAEQ